MSWRIARAAGTGRGSGRRACEVPAGSVRKHCNRSSAVLKGDSVGVRWAAGCYHDDASVTPTDTDMAWVVSPFRWDDAPAPIICAETHTKQHTPICTILMELNTNVVQIYLVCFYRSQPYVEDQSVHKITISKCNIAMGDARKT